MVYSKVGSHYSQYSLSVAVSQNSWSNNTLYQIAGIQELSGDHFESGYSSNWSGKEIMRSIKTTSGNP